MLKQQVLSDIIQPNLATGEKLIGFFQATYLPSGWVYLLLGPLAGFGFRIYYVAVSDLGIHLHKLSMLGKPESHEFFSYPEISKIKLGKAWLQLPISFQFQNGRKITIKAQLKGSDKVPTLDETTRIYLDQMAN